MRIGNRLFPYPLLNNNKLYSQFKTGSFQLVFTEFISDECYTLKGIHCEIDEEYLNELIDNEKARIVCVIECAGAMFRKTYEIGRIAKDLSIPLTEVVGKISVSAFVVANEDISKYFDSDFLDDYEGYSFTVEKNDILAADDGFISKIDFEKDNDNKESSIFIIVKDKNITDEIMNIEYDVSLITISLPEKQWNYYESTKYTEQYKDIYFSMIGIPALVYCIDKIRITGETIEEMRIDYSWFDSFLASYKNIFGKDMTDEILENDNLYTIAQKIFDRPISKSINNLFDMTVGNIGGESNEDQY